MNGHVCGGPPGPRRSPRTRSGLAAALFAIAITPAAWGQFAISVVDADGERPVGAVLNLGAVHPAEPVAARLRIRNWSEAPTVLTTLSVRGTGFALTSAPALPAGVAVGQAIEVGVIFQADAVASFSAELDADGTAVLLTASVLPGVTCRTGGQALGAIGFGSLPTGGAVSRRITVANLTSSLLAWPAISVTGNAFTIVAPPPTAASIAPGETFDFDVVFQPAGVGTWTGSLRIDDRTYPLAGSAVGPSLPKPALTVELADARSGAQGTISVALDSDAQAAGAGTLTLEFTPAAAGAVDSAIQLGVVGRSLPFTIAPGDTRVRFGDLDAVAFQTGTTAGTIAIAVELAGARDRKTIEIPAAPVAIVSAAGTRAAGAIELRVSGYDNTRTAGAVTFTFFDASGTVLATLPVDYTADFASYFAGADGGAFLLRSVFPITGDGSRIAEFAIQMTNRAGSTTTGRVKF